MSRECPACRVRVAPHMTRCPVCGKFMGAVTDEPAPTAYPVVKLSKLRARALLSNFIRALWICAFLSVVINLFFSFGQWERSYWWSAYVVTSAFLLQVSVLSPLKKKRFYWKEASASLWVLLAYLVFVDWYVDGIVTYSMTWIFPISIGVYSVVLGFFMAIRSSDPGNVLMLNMVLLLFSVTTCLVGAFVFTKVIDGYTVLPSFVSMLAVFFIFVFFATFKYKAFVKALFKRFHA